MRRLSELVELDAHQGFVETFVGPVERESNGDRRHRYAARRNPAKASSTRSQTTPDGGVA